MSRSQLRTTRARALQSPLAGFSLIELLVVVTIIALFIGMAMLSLGTAGTDRELQREIERLRTLFDLLSEEALMESRDYGILFSETGYRFYIYDYATLTWLSPSDDRLLSEHVLENPLRLALRLEDREVRLLQDFESMDINEQPEPQAIVFSSGQTTPFAVDAYRELTGGRYSLEVDFDGGTTVSREGFDE